MKPLILNFQERPIRTNNEVESLLEYSSELNLSVLKGTNKPAVLESLLETETITRTGGEVSDSDDSHIKSNIRLETSTITLVNTEESDTDSSLRNKLRIMMDTSTITESIEATDSDPTR